MSPAITCDRPDCDTWMAATGMFFIQVVEATDPNNPMHFCTWDCLLKFASHIEPTEVIPNA